MIRLHPEILSLRQPNFFEFQVELAFYFLEVFASDDIENLIWLKLPKSAEQVFSDANFAQVTIPYKINKAISALSRPLVYLVNLLRTSYGISNCC